MANSATNTFARLAKQRQKEHLVRAQRAAREAARPYDRAWHKIMDAIIASQPHHIVSHTMQVVRQALLTAARETARTVQDNLLSHIRTTHDAVATAWVQSVPAKTWEAMLLGPRRKLQERRGDVFTITDDLRKALGIRVDEPTKKKDAMDILKDLVFPPVSESKVNAILRGISGSNVSPLGRPDWAGKLAKEGFSFDHIVGTVASSISQGKNLREITKDVEPLVDGVRYRAARIARTESIRVAQDTERETWKEMDDVIIGGQIHAVLDKNTRDEHAERNGTMYWKPGHGDGGASFDDMPNTPDAPNCRCWTTPLIAGVDEAPRLIATGGGPDTTTAARFFSVPVISEE